MCKTCSGIENNACLTCDTTKELTLDTNQCVCDATNKYYNSTNEKCEECDTECKTCVNTSSEC